MSFGSYLHDRKRDARIRVIAVTALSALVAGSLVLPSVTANATARAATADCPAAQSSLASADAALSGAEAAYQKAENAFTAAQAAEQAEQKKYDSLDDALKHEQDLVDTKKKEVDAQQDIVDHHDHLVKDVQSDADAASILINAVINGLPQDAHDEKTADNIKKILRRIGKFFQEASTSVKIGATVFAAAEIGDAAIAAAALITYDKTVVKTFKILSTLLALSYAVGKESLDIHSLEKLEPSYQDALRQLLLLREQLRPLEKSLIKAAKALADEVPALNAAQTALDAAQAALAGPHAALTAAQTADNNAWQAVQPACATGAAAVTWGDPHQVTFDHASYDFQQVGEFTAVQSDLDDFQIQVRQQPYQGSSRTIASISAAAMSVAGHRVGVYLTAAGVQTLVDGSAVTLGTAALTLPSGGDIQPGAGSETVQWPDGSFAIVTYDSGPYLNLSIGVASRQQGHLSGLLGNADGNPANDITTRAGQTLPYPATTAELYGSFSASWRVTQAESLFSYSQGQTTATFTDLKFPFGPATLASLPAAAVASATAVCKAAGVTAEPYLDNCILDVATTGDAALAASAAAAQALGTSTTTTTSTLIAASAVGEPWSDPTGAAGSAALTYGHLGCTAVDSQQMCTGGDWAVIPQAPWIWTAQHTTSGQNTVTFTQTVTVTAAQSAQPLTLTAAADDSVVADADGTQVLTAGYSSPVSAPLTLTTGQHTLTFTVTNLPGYDPQNNPAGLAWKLVAG